jgi:hypothetical protein
MEGDLKISNERSFQNAQDNKVEGSQGDGETFRGEKCAQHPGYLQ